LQKKINQTLEKWRFSEPVSALALYRAQKGEADPLVLAQKFPSGFPRVKGEAMHFHLVHPFSFDQFEAGSFKILEPKKELPILLPPTISHCLVPLLAFDSSGARLGRGGGFYDRFLEKFKGIKIGLAFDWQKVEGKLPTEAHDQRLDMVITEKEIYRS